MDDISCFTWISELDASKINVFAKSIQESKDKLLIIYGYYFGKYIPIIDCEWNYNNNYGVIYDF